MGLEHGVVETAGVEIRKDTSRKYRVEVQGEECLGPQRAEHRVGVLKQSLASASHEHLNLTRLVLDWIPSDQADRIQP